MGDTCTTLRLKNTGKKCFHDALQAYRRDWIRPKRKTFSLTKQLCNFGKKHSRLYHFPRLNLHFPDFFLGLDNCWANFKTFSRIQDSVQTMLKQREPVMRQVSAFKHSTPKYGGWTCLVSAVRVKQPQLMSEILKKGGSCQDGFQKLF